MKMQTKNQGTGARHIEEDVEGGSCMKWHM